MNLSIYTLRLENNKYYVGKTYDINNRLLNHENHEGSTWTRKYPVVELMEIVEHASIYDEDKYTLIYMEKYGLDNVRGGSYNQLVLTKEQISYIKKCINMANDKCYNCNNVGHYGKNCPNCKRCGRNHLTMNCYAKTTFDGKYIGKKYNNISNNIQNESDENIKTIDGKYISNIQSTNEEDQKKIEFVVYIISTTANIINQTFDTECIIC